MQTNDNTKINSILFNHHNLNKMNKKQQATARKAADTIIDAPIKVNIGNDTLEVHRPTLRTLVAVSAAINRMPLIEIREGKEIQSVIHQAQYCGCIADIFAILILGARRDTNLWHELRFRRLRNKILDRYTPHELESALGKLFAEMELADFFALTTSLSGINLTKATKEVGK